jgi:hypothetical protein
MKKTAKTTKRRKKFPKGPVVFMFRPTHYEVVSADKLSEWEDAMAQQVGLTATPAQMVSGRTICFCGPDGGGPDDSDWLGPW